MTNEQRYDSNFDLYCWDYWLEQAYQKYKRGFRKILRKSKDLFSFKTARRR